MPNQMSKNKKQFTIAIDRKLLAEVEEAARRQGITRVEYLRLAAAEKLEQDKQKEK